MTAENKARTYGAADPALTARFDGFVLGQDAGDLDGALRLATNADRDSDVGAYRIRASGLASGNYAIAYEDGALRIDPAALTVTAENKARTYGAADPALTARFDGFVLGQDAGDLDGALRLATNADRDSDVGAYRIRASGLASGNYAIAYADGSLRIDPAALTVTAENKARTYGAADPALTARFDGFVLGQDAGDLDGALRLATNADRDSDVGAYRIRASGLASGNYAIAYEDGALRIDPAALTVTAENKARTYGAADPALTARFDGFVLGQDAGDLDGALRLATNADRDSDVGAYRIRASGLASGNYAIAYEDGALRIDPAALTVTAENKARTYGAADPALTARFDGFVLGQDAGDLDGALRLATNADRDSDVGAYRIRASGLASGNYAIAYEDGALRIDPAALTVTAEDKARTEGLPGAPFSARFDGFVLDQNAGDLDGDLDFETTARADSGPGDYLITPGGVTSTNYAITFRDGTLTVEPAPRPEPNPEDPNRTRGPSRRRAARSRASRAGSTRPPAACRPTRPAIPRSAPRSPRRRPRATAPSR